MIDRIPPSLIGRQVALRESKCVVCGEAYRAPAALAWRYSTCSDACSRAKKRATSWGQEERSCAVCGLTMSVAVWNRRRRYCSDSCRMLALNALPRQHRSGLFGRHLTSKGYIRGHEWRDERDVSVLEHRYVMEQHLGRPLMTRERVHHLNGDRTDNRIENLRLYDSHSAHIRHAHVGSGRCRQATSGAISDR